MSTPTGPMLKKAVSLAVYTRRRLIDLLIDHLCSHLKKTSCMCTSNCKTIGRFSTRNHHSSGAILHSFCVFSGRSRNNHIVNYTKSVSVLWTDRDGGTCRIIGHFSIQNHHSSGGNSTFCLHFQSKIPKQSHCKLYKIIILQSGAIPHHLCIVVKL